MKGLDNKYQLEAELLDLKARIHFLPAVTSGLCQDACSKTNDLQVVFDGLFTVYFYRKEICLKA